MKFKIIVFLALMCGSATAKKIPGKIIDSMGNEINVVFKVPKGLLSSTPNFEKMQLRVAYYDSNNVKRFLRPADAKEIRFIYNHAIIRMLSVPDSFSKILFSTGFIFLKLEMDGKLRLFSYFSSGPPGVNPGGGFVSVRLSGSRYLFQKDGGTLTRMRPISFKKDMAQYLADCPEVANKILAKELREGDILQIVREFNQTCGK